MELKNLPPVSDLITRTNSPVLMARTLTPLMEGVGIEHIEVVSGATRSIRLFLTKPTATSVKLGGPWTPERIADELFRLGLEEARYAPATGPGPAIKGWELRLIEIEGAPAILAWTAWIP
jgi:hypothetical protein